MGRPPGAGVGRAPAQVDIICRALSRIEPGTLLGCNGKRPWHTYLSRMLAQVHQSAGRD